MYKSIEQLRKLREEKLSVLDRVYQSRNPDEIYENQRILGSMAVSIYTDVANVLIPVFQEDGVNNVVWSNISLRLEKLSFISIPTVSEIREKYKQGIENPTVVKIEGRAPKKGGVINKKIELPAFLAMLAAQGIAVPIVLYGLFGWQKLALVTVDFSLMTIEVVAYLGFRSKDPKKIERKLSKEPAKSAVNYDEMYFEAVSEVHRDNVKKLNSWFDALERITTEEIEKALKESGGTV